MRQVIHLDGACQRMGGNTANIALTITCEVMIKQMECLLNLLFHLLIHLHLSLLLEECQDLLQGIRSILTGIMQVTDHFFLPRAPQRGNCT